jgi:1-acyl-sn-glycerol-3-phosphate acyltransferase
MGQDMDDQKQNRDVTPEKAGGRLRGSVLPWVYLPWAWLVFIPVLLFTTITYGIIAVLVCIFSPRSAFHIGRFWCWSLCRFNFTRVRLEGRDDAKPGQSYVIMSNHQSHFDVLAFYGHWPQQFRWVLKEELRKAPGLGWYCAAGGHVFVDRSSREKAVASLRAAKSILDKGISVMFFPEGTRSKDGRLGEFKKGGFIMALDLGLPILPVSISGSRHVLPSNSLKLLPGTIRIQVHPPILAAPYGRGQLDRLMTDVKAAINSGLSPWEQGAARSDEVQGPQTTGPEIQPSR